MDPLIVLRYCQAPPQMNISCLSPLVYTMAAHMAFVVPWLVCLVPLLAHPVKTMYTVHPTE